MAPRIQCGRSAHATLCVALASLFVIQAGCQRTMNATVSPLVAARVSDYRQAKAASTVNGALPAATYHTLRARASSEIDYSELTVADMLALDQERLLFTDDANDRVERRLEALARDRSPASVGARVLQLKSATLATWTSEERVGFAREILNDAELPAAFEMGYANTLYDTLDGILDRPERELLRADILATQPFLAGVRAEVLNVPADGNEIESGFRLVRSDDPQDPRTQSFRAALVTYGRRVLARASNAAQPDRSLLQHTINVLSGRSARGELIDAPAPNLEFVWSSMPTLGRLSDLRGQVVVVCFWATWCGACEGAKPAMDVLAEWVTSRGGVFLAVTGSEETLRLDEETVDPHGIADVSGAFIARYRAVKNISWPIAIIKGRAFEPEFGVFGLPSISVIDAEGIVRAADLHPGVPARVEAVLSPLLHK